MDASVTDQEVELMADVLRQRFAGAAGQAAVNFANEHRVIGDETRARHWDRVAAELQGRPPARTLS